MSEENLQLLRVQDPKLAAEEVGGVVSLCGVIVGQLVLVNQPLIWSSSLRMPRGRGAGAMWAGWKAAMVTGSYLRALGQGRTRGGGAQGPNALSPAGPQPTTAMVMMNVYTPELSQVCAASARCGRTKQGRRSGAAC